MPLSPRQRRRALRAHQLRGEGLPLRQIADQLQISHSTARRDLLALETDWPDIARAAAHELILQVVQLCRHRLETLAREGPLGPFSRLNLRTDTLSSDHRIRLHELHNRALRNTASQLLQAVAQLNADTVAAGPIDPADWSAGELPYPLDELTDAQRPAPDNPCQDVPNPTAPNHYQPPRPDRDLSQPGPHYAPKHFTLPSPDASAPPVQLIEVPNELLHRLLREQTPDNPCQDVPNPTTLNHPQPSRPDRDAAQPRQEDLSPFDAFLDRLCGPNPPELRSAHALAKLNGSLPAPPRAPP